MENYSFHYDGSVPMNLENEVNVESNSNDSFEFTDEMRKNIGGNPYVIE